MKGSQWAKVGLVVVAIYVGAYVTIRFAGGLIRTEHRGQPDRAHDISAPEGWSQLLAEMADGNWLILGAAHLPQAMNVVFWPARKVETLVWRMAD